MISFMVITFAIVCTVHILRDTDGGSNKEYSALMLTANTVQVTHEGQTFSTVLLYID